MSDAIPSRPAGPHPTSDEIYRARRDPAWARGSAILTHSATCAACSEEILRQEAFDDPEPSARQLDEAWARFQRSEEASRPAPTRLRTPLLLAATLAACVLGLTVWRLQAPSALMQPAPPPSTPVEVIQGPGGAGGTRGGEDLPGLWSPSGELGSAPQAFVFPPDATKPRRVTVYDETRSYFWTSEPTTSGRVVFPEAERSKLAPGVDYYWTLLGDEAAPSEGAALSFRVALPQRPAP
jgi:hypothetical protein